MCSAINRVSKLFQPLKVIPKDAIMKNVDITSKSQKLMVNLGIIKPAANGTFHLLPLGVRALEKLTKIVDEHMYKIGGQKVLLPALINAKLWQTSGRIKDAHAELFTLKDRHQNSFLLSPTHEEAVSELLASVSPISYRHFPLRLFQITSKFRDEIKPRFGLMRSKEFLMKDMYSFDLTVEDAENTYDKVCAAYDSVFQTIGVDFVKVLGNSGIMGGSLSHEYHYLAPIGEDQLLYCSNCHYSANTQLSGTETCPNCQKSQHLTVTSAIEVGHTFLLGTKYSKPFKVDYLSSKGKPENLIMGSYGIGLSRLLAAAIEVMSLEEEIRWPEILAPFTVILIPPKAGSKEELRCLSYTDFLYSNLESINGLYDNIIVDDRTYLTIGRRQLEAQRVGYPYIVAIGAKAAQETPIFEIIDTKGQVNLLGKDEILNYFSSKFSNLNNKIRNISSNAN